MEEDSAASTAGQSVPICCPPDSHGAATSPDTYTPGGENVTLDNGKLSLYVSRPKPENVGNGEAILVLHDIYGPESGRTKQICDRLASEGYIVVMPTLLENVPLYLATNGGSIINQLRAVWYLRSYKWKKLKAQLLNHVIPYMSSELKVNSIGLLCYCWGAYPMVHLLAEDIELIKCAVGLHPSLIVFGVQLENVSSYLKQVKVPVTFLAAGSDSSDIKPNGSAEKALSNTASFKDCMFKEYESQKHGWTNRGDLSDESILRDYEDAYKITVSQFKKFV
mmetsp:Transcript_6391/g.7318  ORF Transcript_6391/g.7318 Transcript_6391/m.7318 type:complete len:279 (+) Transcript_6391:120-956(+)|eukprot:CAMPEP_0184014620 /NCGR_PEP_ID=MMETSP0954-20121128/5786_1 /TAXON_ID=627963 /ORGANISM="Aplanochytrium sp, Strain PBS07" /LENGTH=278 /DNA_ID=CAMNT_0026295173 /DNA_START=119 /DNA_END=955 /DNA_ORIENTATION=-